MGRNVGGNAEQRADVCHDRQRQSGGLHHPGIFAAYRVCQGYQPLRFDVDRPVLPGRIAKEGYRSALGVAHGPLGERRDMAHEAVAIVIFPVCSLPCRRRLGQPPEWCVGQKARIRTSHFVIVLGGGQEVFKTQKEAKEKACDDGCRPVCCSRPTPFPRPGSARSLAGRSAPTANVR